MTPSDTAGAVIETTPFLINAALFLHITGGAVGLVSGFVAVLAPKGRKWHRGAGTVFFMAMMAMTGFGAVVALFRYQPINITAAFFTMYMVFTAWLTVKRRDGAVGVPEAGAALAGLGLAAFGFTIGMADAGSFGTVVAVFSALALLGVALDVKVFFQRGVSGVARTSRHLWRMCTALFVASASFFLGQMDEIPAVWRGPHLYALAFAPLVLLVVWLIRVRIKRAPKAVMAT